MSNPFEDQEQFMRACGQTVGVDNPDQYNLYVDLVFEETRELTDAIADYSHACRRQREIGGNSAEVKRCKAEIVDGAIDTMVVCIGLLSSQGISAQRAWDIVHATNVAKVDPDTGLVRKREDGKILKPLNWRPPDLLSLIERAA